MHSQAGIGMNQVLHASGRLRCCKSTHDAALHVAATQAQQ
jgi:hypothetical protein